MISTALTAGNVLTASDSLIFQAVTCKTIHWLFTLSAQQRKSFGGVDKEDDEMQDVMIERKQGSRD